MRSHSAYAQAVRPRSAHRYCCAAGFWLLWGAAWSTRSNAAEIHVPGDYPTLQSGLDAAQPGDTVVAANGVYSGPGNRNLDFHGKAITLKGNGPRKCIIDCQASTAQRARAFYFHSGESAETLIEGFTIRGGHGDQDGGAIRCINASPTFRGCVITGNAASGPPLPNLHEVAAYWSLNETNGIVASDQGGGNHDAFVVGAKWMPGISGGALRFNGANDFALVAETGAFALSSGFTIAAWIKGNYNPNGSNVLIARSGSYEFGLSKGHPYVQLQVGAPSSSTRTVVGATWLPDNQWRHIAVAFEPDEPSGPADLSDYTGLRGDAGNPVVPPGSESEWDHRIREIGNVLYEPDDPVSGRRYKIFYSGYNGPYEGNNVYVGYAYSGDGVTWTKAGQVHERPLEDPYVIKQDGVYYLYAEDKLDMPFRNIRRLRSPDCQSWIDEGDVFDVRSGGTPQNWEATDVSSPVVWIEGDAWYMLYEGRGGNTSGRVGLATSTDGLNWNRHPNNPVFGNGAPGEWDESNVVSDDVFKSGDTYYFFYHGYGRSQLSGFWTGMATSTDLLQWTRYARNPISQSETVMALRGPDGLFLYVMDPDSTGGIGRHRPFRIRAPRLYVNGVEDRYWQRDDTGDHSLAGGSGATVIGRAANGSRSFNGLLDEARVYQRALSAGELREPAEDFAAPAGGAVACEAGSHPRFIDCVFSANEAIAVGGAIYADDESRPTVVNCTVAGNETLEGVAGGLFFSAGGVVENSILWGNSAASPPFEFAGVADISHSDVSDEVPGSTNLHVDPEFVNAEQGDYHLGVGSSCINAGNPDILPILSLTDPDGRDRQMCGGIDIGAYEYGMGDPDCDRQIGLNDFRTLADCETSPGEISPATCKLVDFDGDGDVELADFSELQNNFSASPP